MSLFNLKNDDLENAIYIFVKIETNMWISIPGEACKCANYHVWKLHIKCYHL